MLMNRFKFFAIFSVFALVLGSSLVLASSDQKEWTFLVYINGNNNLDPFGKYNINQMEGVGSTDQVNVLVQWASLENKKTQRLFVHKDNDTSRVSSPVLEDLGKVDMGDWHSLVQFIQWGVDHFPARHYFITVWDHGSGWHALKYHAQGQGFHPMDISVDDQTGNSITTPQLGEAMKEAARIIGHKVDVYGSDACLMAMAEIASEMKDSVEYYIGSQELEPGEGWPYRAILSQWNQKEQTTAEEVAKIVTTEYVKSYQGGENGTEEVTFSAYNLQKTERLYAAIGEVGRRLLGLDLPARKKTVQLFSKAQMFYHSDYRDFLDFLDLLEKSRISPQLKAEDFNEVRMAISDYVIANATTSYYQRAKGLSIWLPGKLSTYNRYSNYYNTLQFQGDTKWGNTLKDLLKSTATP